MAAAGSDAQNLPLVVHALRALLPMNPSIRAFVMARRMAILGTTAAN
jgi:hypothetical protein